MASLLVFSFALLPFAASDAVPETRESSTADTTEILLTIDVTNRYTEGQRNEGANPPSAGKIIFIGIACLLLLAGIIIIAVKSRDYDDGEEETEASVLPENGEDEENN